MPSFPRTILEFQSSFATEEQCWNYLVRVRWPGKPVCPQCGEPSAALIETRKLFRCSNGHQFSATTRTVLHRSHVPLQKWFWAAYLVTTQTPGISAWVLHRQIGVAYETAYMMLQRLRAGMVNPDRSKFSGVVEVDEGYISSGVGRKTRRGRGTSKALVVLAVEVKSGGGAGRIRLRKVPSSSAASLCGFISDHIEGGSKIITDGLSSYSGLEGMGYRHVVRTGDTSEEVAKQMPHVHKAIGNLRAWLIGTHHGVSDKHLQAYLNEFTFRYNRRGSPQAGFLAVLGISANRRGPEYGALYAAGETGGWRHPNPKKAARYG